MKNYTAFIIIFCFLFLPSILHAQPSFTDDVVDAPIDGGMSLLIAAGIGYTAKSYKNKVKSTVQK